MTAGVDLADPKIIRALSHPLRARILRELEDSQGSPVELSKQLGASLGTVSYHVKILEELGLIRLVKTTPRRGALEHHYRARPRRTSGREKWDQLPAAARGEAARQAAKALGAVISKAAAAGGFGRKGSGIHRLSLTLDQEGWKEARTEVEALVKRLRDIERTAGKRIGDAGAEVPAGVTVALFELPAEQSRES